MSSNSNSNFSAGFVNMQGDNRHSGFQVQALFGLLANATISAKTKLLQIQSRRSSISIGDMFEMQMLMNHLAQLSEMATGVVSASHSAIMSMARGVKG